MAEKKHPIYNIDYVDNDQGIVRLGRNSEVLSIGLVLCQRIEDVFEFFCVYSNAHNQPLLPHNIAFSPTLYLPATLEDPDALRNLAVKNFAVPVLKGLTRQDNNLTLYENKVEIQNDSDNPHLTSTQKTAVDILQENTVQFDIEEIMRLHFRNRNLN